MKLFCLIIFSLILTTLSACSSQTAEPLVTNIDAPSVDSKEVDKFLEDTDVILSFIQDAYNTERDFTIQEKSDLNKYEVAYGTDTKFYESVEYDLQKVYQETVLLQFETDNKDEIGQVDEFVEKLRDIKGLIRDYTKK